MALPDLYPAQVGSPYTTLSASYTTEAATMSLTDATKLPNAPNIVCLSGTVSGEFRYTGKSGNDLTGVSKLEGTPTATWAAGTYAFRGIAAYDMTSLQTRAAALQEQVDLLNEANSPIIGVSWDTTSSSPTLDTDRRRGKHSRGNEHSLTSTSIFVSAAGGGVFGIGPLERSHYGTNARGDGLTLDGHCW